MQILFQIVVRDIFQFGIIFAVFLFSFSGGFYLALRGEDRGSLQQANSTICNSATTGALCNLTNAENEGATMSELNTSLNIYPYETA